MMTESNEWSVAVVIPAQNEAATIERCIASVIAAADACMQRSHLWVVLVADTCTDDTVALAQRAIGIHGEVIECSPRSPGTARRIGVGAALAHFAHAPPGRVWIANTDADTYVPVNWIACHLGHADNHADAVAGIVELDTSEGLRADISRLYATTYELRSDGTHSHVHGANLGVRGDAYLDAGGWSHVTVAEDHCLWGRLKERGWQLRSCVDSVVITSARLHGRAIGGFADTLRRNVEPDSCLT
jgi:cellulose synthase/poly-beta-1,6-N-acetylglucosamine synthase-like glycosyltransferase